MVKKIKDKKAALQSFEQSFKKLEKIVNILEHGEVSLEESMKMFEEGVELSKICLEQLTQAELKLKKLTKDLEGKFELTEIEELE